MDNFHFDMISTGEDKLKKAFSLLHYDKVVAYSVSEQKGLVAYWHLDDKATALPYPMTLEQFANFAIGWLESADYGSRPDIDGDCEKGWRLYTESCGS